MTLLRILQCVTIGIACASVTACAVQTAPSDKNGTAADGGTAACAATQSLCSGLCVDPSSDSKNCGSCGSACPAGTTCAAGSCCPAPTILCGAKCLDPREDDANCGACGTSCQGGHHCVNAACVASKIQHVVLLIEENHTFDAYFGRYCQAPTGSSPTCTSGPSCCERAPDTEPKGASPRALTDETNFATDRAHLQACELREINGGKMDGFVTGSGTSPGCVVDGPCSSPDNWALAGQATVGAYWSFADSYALADRYFQPVAGGTASNNMYFAIAHFQFLDNSMVPNGVGSPHGCFQGVCLNGSPITYQGRQTIADLLIASGKTFRIYADGYADANAAAPACQSIPSDCPYDPILHPVAAQACRFDATDIPFGYYASFLDGAHVTDYGDLEKDLTSGALPNFAYVKAREFRNEHPNVSKISDGVAFVSSTIQAIQNSPEAGSTLILLTWDEGGGFFDHVSPPVSIDTDDQGQPVPYGTRVPLLAIGTFARKGTISHVQMEHSSIVRFLEYNFLGPVGQLGFNDSKVHNIGSMLDANLTGIRVPED
jgi:phospholipase C